METINKEEDIKLLSIIKADQVCNSEKQKAFNCLYNKYQAALRNYVRQIAGGVDEFSREEIFCVTMAKAFTKINSFKPDYPFIVWLRKIALNSFIDMGRKKLEKYQPLNEVPENVKSADGDDPYSKIVQKQLIGHLQQFIQGLSRKQREVVNLRLNYNFSCKQISEKLQLPLGTVTTILFRSRILIKKFGICEI
ncbi:MAG TPA: sigma-70 family RNA polymerase sigma factor [Bacteroidia bacterium]|nr:sigma-70 family RNA polymerase sigma factor [Bacteroidia bacterium]